MRRERDAPTFYRSDLANRVAMVNAWLWRSCGSATVSQVRNRSLSVPSMDAATMSSCSTRQGHECGGFRRLSMNACVVRKVSACTTHQTIRPLPPLYAPLATKAWTLSRTHFSLISSGHDRESLMRRCSIFTALFLVGGSAFAGSAACLPLASHFVSTGRAAPTWFASAIMTLSERSAMQGNDSSVLRPITCFARKQRKG